MQVQVQVQVQAQAQVQVQVQARALLPEVPPSGVELEAPGVVVLGKMQFRRWLLLLLACVARL